MIFSGPLEHSVDELSLLLISLVLSLLSHPSGTSYKFSSVKRHLLHLQIHTQNSPVQNPLWPGADPGIYWGGGGGQTKFSNRKLRTKPESTAQRQSARESRAKPESKKRIA